MFENILGKFETYVYQKLNFIFTSSLLFYEFKWLGKNVDYVRNKDIKDGGIVYWNKLATIYLNNISILVKLYEKINRLGCSFTDKILFLYHIRYDPIKP